MLRLTADNDQKLLHREKATLIIPMGRQAGLYTCQVAGVVKGSSSLYSRLVQFYASSSSFVLSYYTRH